MGFLLFLLLICNSAFADIVSVKSPELSGKVTVTSNLVLTEWQTIMSCHFDYKGSRKESVRYLQTNLKNTEINEYSMTIKKGSLSEALPNWRLLTCAYKILFLGKNMDLSGRAIMGEIFLLGQENGEMSADELKHMQNKNFVAKYLADKVEDMKLTISSEGLIVAE